MAVLVRQARTRWLDADGRRVPKGTPGARKVTEKGRYWYAQGVPGWKPGKRKRLATNKAAAQQMLAELVRQAERGEAGLSDEASKARCVPLTKHLDAFEEYLRHKPKTITPKQVQLVMTRCRSLVAGCGFETLPDITTEKVSKWLAGQRARPAEEGGFSVRTSNFYIGALNQFLRWMKKTKKLVVNPLEGLEKGNPEEDIRRPRRGISPDEVGWLMRTVEESQRNQGRLSGRERWFLYAVAACTGLRAKELRDLTPERFLLDEDPPRIDLPPRQVKNRKRTLQPLPASIVPLLRDWLVSRPAGQPVWGLTWYNRAAEMLRRDLTDATRVMQEADPSSPGIPYRTEEGFFDFHGWRHSFITWLDGTGASTREAQLLARHSDPRLTMNTYTHARLGGLASAVDRLPLPFCSRTEDAQSAPTPEQLALLVLLQDATLAFLLGTRRGTQPTTTSQDEAGRNGKDHGPALSPSTNGTR
jgi:integrase